MKKLKKLIKRCFLLMVAVIVLAGCVLAGNGYKMYRDALNHQSLESKVAEIQSNPSYTTLSEMPELYLDAVVAVEKGSILVMLPLPLLIQLNKISSTL